MTTSEESPRTFVALEDASVADCYLQIAKLRVFYSHDERQQLAVFLEIDPVPRWPIAINPNMFSAKIKVSDEVCDESYTLRYFQAEIRAWDAEGM